MSSPLVFVYPRQIWGDITNNITVTPDSEINLTTLKQELNTLPGRTPNKFQFNGYSRSLILNIGVSEDSEFLITGTTLQGELINETVNVDSNDSAQTTNLYYSINSIKRIGGTIDVVLTLTQGNGGYTSLVNLDTNRIGPINYGVSGIYYGTPLDTLTCTLQTTNFPISLPANPHPFLNTIANWRAQTWLSFVTAYTDSFADSVMGSDLAYAFRIRILSAYAMSSTNNDSGCDLAFSFIQQGVK